MTKTASGSSDSMVRMLFAGLLGWILPGSGHLFIGERTRGIILTATIALTFWTGVAIGGVKNTVAPAQRSLWFLGQICAGGHTLTALAWGSQIPAPRDSGADAASVIGYGRSEEVSVVYTAIAGMLNVLVILDVLVRAERRPVAVAGGATVKRKGTG